MCLTFQIFVTVVALFPKSISLQELSYVMVAILLSFADETFMNERQELAACMQNLSYSVSNWEDMVRAQATNIIQFNEDSVRPITSFKMIKIIYIIYNLNHLQNQNKTFQTLGPLVQVLYPIISYVIFDILSISFLEYNVFFSATGNHIKTFPISFTTR